MFDNLSGSVKELAELAYANCTIEELKEEKDHPNHDLMDCHHLSVDDWEDAHNAAIEEKENEAS